MKNLSLLISIILIGQLANAQITFQKTYGGTSIDYGFSVCQTFDNGYFITGGTDNGISGNYIDAYLIRTDSLGNILWTKTFGETNVDVATDGIQTADSGFIVYGRERILAGNTDSAPILIKFDSNGDTLWTKTYLIHAVNSLGNEMKQTTDGGYIFTNGTLYGNNGINLVKTDSVGIIQWAKAYQILSDEHPRTVIQTNDSGFMIAGLAIDSTNNNVMLLIKTNTMGDTLWSHSYNLAGGSECAYSLIQNADSSYFVAATANNNTFCLMKIDQNGTPMWMKGFINLVLSANPFILIKTRDGKLAVSGQDGWSRLFLIKIDTAGTVDWLRFYDSGSSSSLSSLNQTTDNGYIMAGRTLGFGAGNSDVYFIKTDSMGISGCIDSTAIPNVTNLTPIMRSPPLVTSTLNIADTLVALTFSSKDSTTTICSSVGIAKVNSSHVGFRIFPNPATTTIQLTFNTKHNGAVQCEIWNVMGERVFTSPLTPLQRRGETTAQIDVSFLAKGVYVVRVVQRTSDGGDGGSWENKKLVVE